MAEGHRARLRKRLMEEDIDEIPEYAVLEMILAGAIQRRDTCEIARQLIGEFGSLFAVMDAPYELLKNFPGVGEAAAAQIKLIPKFYRKYRLSKWQDGSKSKVLKNSEHVRDFIVDKFIGCDEEEFIVVCLADNGGVLHVDRVSKGSVNAVHVSVYEVIKLAVLYKAMRVIVAHNHVGGNALPSPKDCETTRILNEELGKIGVKLEDHIVVSEDDYVSVFEFMAKYMR
ncbi:MAG: hypothetical protein IKU84_06015 [Clostridia bacterium]|nr:hypothetical protein [Clostridia bacterium]